MKTKRQNSICGLTEVNMIKNKKLIRWKVDQDFFDFVDEISIEYGKGQLEINSSMDRIDSTKGYIKGNVQIISRLANTMKSNASIDTLLDFATGIFLKHGNIELIEKILEAMRRRL